MCSAGDDLHWDHAPRLHDGPRAQLAAAALNILASRLAQLGQDAVLVQAAH